MRTIYQNCDKLKSYFGSFRNFMDSAQCNSKNIERHGCNEGSTRDARNKVTAAAQSSSKDVKHHGSNKGSTRDVRSKITASSPSMEHLSSLSERNDIIQSKILTNEDRIRYRASRSRSWTMEDRIRDSSRSKIKLRTICWKRYSSKLMRTPRNLTS